MNTFATRVTYLCATGLCLLLHSVPGIAQETREFVIVSVHGDASVWVLPADWRPRFEGEYLVLTDANRKPARNVAAVRPKRSTVAPGTREVKVAFRTTSGKDLHQYFHVPEKYATLEQVPREGEFLRIDEQTLLRVGSYTVLTE